METPNTRVLVPVFGTQNQKTTAATAAIPLMIMMTIRFTALIIAGLSRAWELGGIRETGERSAAPHFLQKMRPAPPEVPHWEQAAF